MPCSKTSKCKIKSQASSKVINLHIVTHKKTLTTLVPHLINGDTALFYFFCTTNAQQKRHLSVCGVVAALVNLLVFLSGNLYSRHIQIDGEMLAIQVQDTPGVQVSQMQPRSSPKQL